MIFACDFCLKFCIADSHVNRNPLQSRFSFLIGLPLNQGKLALSTSLTYHRCPQSVFNADMTKFPSLAARNFKRWRTHEGTAVGGVERNYDLAYTCMSKIHRPWKFNNSLQFVWNNSRTWTFSVHTCIRCTINRALCSWI